MSPTQPLAPGSWRPVVDRWGPFVERDVPDDALVVADARVLRLHKAMARSLRARHVIALTAGERAKSLETVGRLALKTLGVARSTTLVAIGGGTIGDVATVFAHVLKRGVKLIHVPTTLLAAVDSSVGGKGAVNVGVVKNALGVFHCAEESWVCPEVFATLTESQRREGRLEAWKMVLGDQPLFAAWSKRTPDDETLIRQARALKARICAADPYEQFGVRTVLNFGHTFGHVIESVTRHRVRHGQAVGLGMLCALDVGVALGVTPAEVARDVEARLPNGAMPRARLANVLGRVSARAISVLLRADKKGASRAGQVRMVLLERPGRWCVEPVPEKVWASLLTSRWSVGT